MTTEIVVRDEARFDKTRLDQIAVEIREGHEEVKRSVERALRAALAVGRLLNEAREMFPAHGGWTDWVESECALSYQTANYYRRLAHYEKVLPGGINVIEAIDYVKGLPSLDGRSYIRQHPQAVIEEARRRRKQGQTLQQISDGLEVSIGTVARWCRGPGKDRWKEKRRQRALAKLAKREELRQQAAKEAKRRGGSIGQAYSLMRKLSQELDAASSEYSPGDPIRQELRSALSDVNSAEAHICSALGIDYGSWRGDRPNLSKRQGKAA